MDPFQTPYFDALPTTLSYSCYPPSSGMPSFPSYELEPSPSYASTTSPDSTTSFASFQPPPPSSPPLPPLNFKYIPRPKLQGKPRQRVNSNLKERRRNNNINEAFKDLQTRIPNVPAPALTPLPKIKTLRLAIQYIRTLETQLSTAAADLDSLGKDFAPVVAAELQTRNSYKSRAEHLLKEMNEVEEEEMSAVWAHTHNLYPNAFAQQHPH